MTVVPLTSEYTQAVQDQAIQNITDYLNSLEIGTSAQASSLYLPALSAMANLQRPSFRISSLAINKDGANTAAVTTQTSGSMSLIVSSVAGLTAGMVVSGEGIPPGTIITSIDSENLTLILSQAATTTASSGTVTFFSDTVSIAWNEVATIGDVTVTGGL